MYKTSEVKGEWLRYYPHALGFMLGTGFMKFESLAGTHGLAKEHGQSIEILAVHASAPNSGQFRNFIASLKESFAEIYILEVWNPDLRKTLARYGFSRTRRTESDGEELSGFKWNKETLQSEPKGAQSSP